VLISILTLGSSEVAENSDKNEGFLKSMWHKLTDDPAHKAATSGESTKSDDKKSAEEDKNNPKKEDSPKKE
jgi:molecular chaperone DnaJ